MSENKNEYEFNSDMKYTESTLRLIADLVQLALTESFGKKLGFFMTVFEFSDSGIANYVSNCNREDAIKSLKETAKRLEKNEDIPAIKGSA